MGILSCVILLFGLPATATHPMAFKSLNYLCLDTRDPLCDFCRKFADRGTKVAVFPGMARLRAGLTAHMKVHLSDMFNKFHVRVDKRMEELQKNMSAEFQRIKTVLHRTSVNRGDSFTQLTRHFQNFISCIRLLSNAAFTKALERLTEATVIQLPTVMHDIYGILTSIAATTLISLGDIMGHSNCVNLLDTIENCCISHLVRVSNPTDVTRPLVNASGTSANLCEDSTSLKHFLGALSDLLRAQTADACG